MREKIEKRSVLEDSEGVQKEKQSIIKEVRESH